MYGAASSRRRRHCPAFADFRNGKTGKQQKAIYLMDRSQAQYSAQSLKLSATTHVGRTAPSQDAFTFAYAYYITLACQYSGTRIS